MSRFGEGVPREEGHPAGPCSADGDGPAEEAPHVPEEPPGSSEEMDDDPFTGYEPL
ncbi:hypothetical protein [Streptomyces sp. CA2R106]|uniref:hypothetical protein n=1 Tax=Streptomyces sp. CA2R106 TaxID=3120153 RepID=UPI00300B8ACC